MSGFIQGLVQRLQSVDGLPMRVMHNSAQILVTMQVAHTRQQTVKMTLRSLPAGLGYAVCFQSRAGFAKSPESVRSALAANNHVALGGFCLDTTTSPPSIDLVYNLVADELDFDEFLTALQLVAHHADAIEQRTSGKDDF